MAKRKVEEVSDEEPPPAKKQTKAEKIAEARARAKFAMASDKAKVDALKAKRAGSTASASAPSPAKRRKLDSPPLSRKTAKEEALQRAKDKAALEKKKKALTKTTPGKKTAKKGYSSSDDEDADVKAAAAAQEGAVMAQGGQSPNPARAATATALNLAHQPPMDGPVNPAAMAQYMMHQQMIGGYSPYGYGMGYGTAPGYNAAPGYSSYGSPPSGYANVPSAGYTGYAPGYNPAMMSPSQTQASVNMNMNMPAPSASSVAAPPANNARQVAPSKPAAAVAFASPPAAPSRMPPPASKASATPIPNDEDDDDDLVPPPPMTQLESQISARVMANCAAALKNEPLPYQDAPPGADDYQPENADEEEEEIDEEPIYIDDEDEPVVDQAQGRLSLVSFFKKSIMVSIGVGVLSYFFMLQGGVFDWPESGKFQEQQNLSYGLCYIDTEALDAPTCDQNGVACPAGGVCAEGRLARCMSTHYQVSHYSNACILTQQTNETIASLQGLLAEWSIEKMCGSSSSFKMPVFDYSELQLANALPMDLLMELFFTERHDDNKLFVGLPKDHRLNLPVGCRLMQMTKSVLSGLGSLTMTSAHGLGSVAWSITSAYPLVSLLGLIVVLLFKRRRDVQAHRQQVLIDVAHVRQMTYQRLQEDPSISHVVLHIRDEVGMSLFPDSKKQRVYLQKEVWPRVVPNLLQDNRVRKSTKVMEGNPRDVWQWVAAPVSAKKKTTFDQ
jgi:hypothetical protein